MYVLKCQFIEFNTLFAIENIPENIVLTYVLVTQAYIYKLVNYCFVQQFSIPRVVSISIFVNPNKL